MTLTKPIDSTVKFDFESPRLFQIIQESIQIINQTKNPATAIRRFDDIKRTMGRLFDILPSGKTIDIEVNGRKVTAVKDLHIIDEEKEKWMEEHKVKPNTTAEIITIARAQAAEQIRQQELPITGISADAKEKLYATLADAAMKGQSPKDITGKIIGIIGDFEWPEFDDWCKIFKEAGEWPPLWNDMAEYFFMQDYPIEDLLLFLHKDDLVRLSADYKTNIKKSDKKEVMISTLKTSIPESDRDKVAVIAQQKWYPRFLRAKRYLLSHSLTMGYSFEEIKSQNKDVADHIEIMPAPECCSWCEKERGHKIKVDTLTQKQLPPFHPGCRCVVIPAD